LNLRGPTSKGRGGKGGTKRKGREERGREREKGRGRQRFFYHVYKRFYLFIG